MFKKDNNAGLYMTIAVHLVLLIVLLSSRIGYLIQEESSFVLDFTKEEEIERLEKEKAKLEGEIKRAAGKLTNQGFLAKAPQSLVDEETAKKEKYEEMLSSINERILQLRKK